MLIIQDYPTPIVECSEYDRKVDRSVICVHLDELGDNPRMVYMACSGHRASCPCSVRQHVLQQTQGEEHN